MALLRVTLETVLGEADSVVASINSTVPGAVADRLDSVPPITDAESDSVTVVYASNSPEVLAKLQSIEHVLWLGTSIRTR